jgi:hypothetical protein
MGIFCEEARVSHILGVDLILRMMGCFLANFKPNRGDAAIKHCILLRLNLMSQMVIIYIIWQEMFLNGQILLMTLTHMSMSFNESKCTRRF